MTTTDIFLDETQLIRFTGRKAKSRQIEWLRSEGVTFRVNATGHPVVTRTAVEGRRHEVQTDNTGWTPNVLQLQRAA